MTAHRPPSPRELYEAELGHVPPVPAESGHPLAHQWLYRGTSAERDLLAEELRDQVVSVDHRQLTFEQAS